MSELPIGVITFLFTDIVGGTRMWEGHQTAMERAHARHCELIAEAV